MQMKDFIRKPVPGLHSYTHFEHPCGAFIQAHVYGNEYIYQDSKGGRHTVRSMWDLKDLVAKDEPVDLSTVASVAQNVGQGLAQNPGAL